LSSKSGEGVQHRSEAMLPGPKPGRLGDRGDQVEGVE
jgi:hypothetical protein